MNCAIQISIYNSNFNEIHIIVHIIFHFERCHLAVIACHRFGLVFSQEVYFMDRRISTCFCIYHCLFNRQKKRKAYKKAYKTIIIHHSWVRQSRPWGLRHIEGYRNLFKGIKIYQDKHSACYETYTHKYIKHQLVLQ